MKFSAYPIQCEPILKERIWGGTKWNSLKKELSSDTPGESWELSTVPGDISRVANGIYNGKLLTELIEMFPEEILGVSIAKKFGAQLPLLFKFIDAREDLSIQVHPDDMLAKKRHNTFGKTEMWYIMQADADARLIVGFKQDASADLYL